MEVLSTLDEIINNMNGDKPKSPVTPLSDTQQIMIILKSISDKVNGIDRYLRSRHSGYSGQTFTTPAQEEASREMQKRLNDKSLEKVQRELNAATGTPNCS